MATPRSKRIVARGQGTLEEVAGLGFDCRADDRDFARGDMAFVDPWRGSVGVENTRRESREREVAGNRRLDV